MSGSNHHFTQAVDCKQCISADFEYAITVGNQFDLSFFDTTAVHMNISGYTVENFCRFIFVKNTLLFFPNIETALFRRKEVPEYLLRERCDLF